MTQLLQNAAYGAALILAVSVLRQVMKDRLIPEARLALWAVCLFRLLTPAAPESVLSLWGLSRLFQPQQAPAVPAPTPAPQLYIPAQAAPTPAGQGVPWGAVLAAVWLTVGAALAVRYVLSWKRTRRAVACAIPLDRNDERYTSLPRFVRLREGPIEGAPLTFGVARPTVVLSPGLSGEDLDCVLAHEGVHAKRRDNLWHYIMALALVVHWWNPAVWLMSRLLRRDIELSCDRAAVRKLGADRRADYAQALVSLATQESGPDFCQTFGRKAVEERILSIMKFKKISVIGVVFTLALVLAVTMAFASDPKSARDDIPGDVLAYAEHLYPGMSREDVRQLLGEPSFSSSRPFSDTYELDPDTHERQLGIFYAVNGSVTQVKYFSDGTGSNIDGIDLGAYLSSTASANPVMAVSATSRDGKVIDYTVRLDALRASLERHVADGSMTGQDAAMYLDIAEFFLDEDGKAMVWSFQGDSGLELDEDHDVCCRDEQGNLVKIDPAAVISKFIFPSSFDMPTYVEEDETIADAAIPGLLGEGNIRYDEGRIIDDVTDVKLPTFDENGTSVITDEDGSPIIIGQKFYSYEVVLDGSAASGEVVRTSSGTHKLCDGPDCDIDDPHFHLNGQVIKVHYQDPADPSAAPSAIPDPGPAPSQYTYPRNSKGETYGSGAYGNPDLILAYGTNNETGYIRDRDTLHGQYGPINTPEDAMKYMAWLKNQPAEYTIPLYDSEGNVIGQFAMSNPEGVQSSPATAPSAAPSAAAYPVCSVDGCTLTGRHDHNGVTYCGGAAHHSDSCDGSCIYRTQQSVSSGSSAQGHHSGSHHSNGHH